MQDQEIIKKKREIIDVFLKRGILVGSDFLRDVEDAENENNISKILASLESKTNEDLVVISSDLSRFIRESTNQKNTEQPKESNIRITNSYSEDPKKREPQDFVDYFHNRYK